jgi:hypothetical protein
MFLLSSLDQTPWTRLPTRPSASTPSLGGASQSKIPDARAASSSPTLPPATTHLSRSPSPIDGNRRPSSISSAPDRLHPNRNSSSFSSTSQQQLPPTQSLSSLATTSTERTVGRLGGLFSGREAELDRLHQSLTDPNYEPTLRDLENYLLYALQGRRLAEGLADLHRKNPELMEHARGVLVERLGAVRRAVREEAEQCGGGGGGGGGGSGMAGHGSSERVLGEDVVVEDYDAYMSDIGRSRPEDGRGS